MLSSIQVEAVVNVQGSQEIFSLLEPLQLSSTDLTYKRCRINMSVSGT